MDEQELQQHEQRVRDWKKAKGKLKVIEKVIAYLGAEYQRFAGEVFSDYLFTSEDLDIKSVLGFIDRLSKNNINKDVSPKIEILVAHIDFLKELIDVRKEIVQQINVLQPDTMKQSPIPTVNS